MGVTDKDVFYQLGSCQYKNKEYAPSIESLSRAIAAGIATIIYNRKKNRLSTAAADAYNSTDDTMDNIDDTMDNTMNGIENQIEHTFS